VVELLAARRGFSRRAVKRETSHGPTQSPHPIASLFSDFAQIPVGESLGQRVKRPRRRRAGVQETIFSEQTTPIRLLSRRASAVARF
jgi:hypothetical protein